MKTMTAQMKMIDGEWVSNPECVGRKGWEKRVVDVDEDDNKIVKYFAPREISAEEHEQRMRDLNDAIDNEALGDNDKWDDVLHYAESAAEGLSGDEYFRRYAGFNENVCENETFSERTTRSLRRIATEALACIGNKTIPQMPVVYID